ncbi:TetR/AcrR family transcriptional regulator [Catenovulum sp. SM1970]|uniref:TetR/AcrR family transcriptional regulator n=1 Tax=Marinifaba aquimaris TaxID=2741323 RepID=UPI0015737196|nr:TetR/AcrR family transcriptional regulator [Marinifaba aquimaris]NTS78386.1 TetR/AcrR family transcriptional regulator [Marinifaba aquimaris]
MRDAELTRQKILEVAADEIHKQGFTATSLSCILKRTGVSKGALYHHFDNKLELGYAVFEEVYTPQFLEAWRPAVEVEDPISGLIAFFSSYCQQADLDDLMCGCPLNNLCQEMSSVDEGFRVRILSLQQQLNTLIASNLDRVSDKLRDGVDTSQAAYFMVASFHGANNLAKSSRNTELFEKVIAELCSYIKSLST